MPPCGRRRLSKAVKQRIVEEASCPGAAVWAVARRYGIDTRLLFRWKQELAPTAYTETTFMPITITDALVHAAEAVQPTSGPAPVIVERSASGIEVELIRGRRVRFDPDTDPETIRQPVSQLEGEAR